jgi:hypothetical protein
MFDENSGFIIKINTNDDTVALEDKYEKLIIF